MLAVTQVAAKKKHKVKLMDTTSCPFFIMRYKRFILTFNLILSFIILSACAEQTTPTPFRPPTSIPPTQIIFTSTPIPTTFSITETPTQQIIFTPTESVCTNVLSFLDDVTVEDGTSFLPNAQIDKQWLIKNDGTCDWDSTYKLQWVGGDPMSANTTQALYPARAGTQATIRILFTAPTDVGEYESAWQAVDPDGNFFGDLIFIQIVVTQ
ncbi:MAG TPA: hypothetical protein DEP19_03985 [Anaerolineae bacterium]|nr:hypothetical protein [Anaerolineae bacterium]HCK65261.1 hypothetical protein [Anaerolineae bacterium]